MRRDARRRTEVKKWWEDKKIILSGSIVSMTLAIIIGVAIYSRDNSVTNQNQIISLAPESEIKEETESTSTSIGKSIEESNTEISNNSSSTSNTTVNDTAINNSTNNTVATNTSNSKTNNKTKTNTTIQKQHTASTVAQPKKEIEFEWPVKGDIIKAFSIDNLLYSSTLQEWTVHNGIDIKADKTTVIGAAADGKIKSIKNDPRYGLTVIIEHDDGFKTIYSNLLTSEFVVEGENVSKGQTIGTVGNSANFEIAEDSHLHFEMLKNDDYVDPMLYLK